MSADTVLDLLFREGRTYHAWQKKDVPEALLSKVYDLCKMGPTSTNCCPLRIRFIRTPEAKEKLKDCLMEANIPQTVSAPVTAIIGYDLEFYTQLPFLSPQNNAHSWFVGDGKEAYVKDTAIRNGTLQGAYFILAARACGLDCGPMSGFNQAKVDQLFFQGTQIKSNFLCNLGYGDPASLYPRGPRLDFSQACAMV